MGVFSHFFNQTTSKDAAKKRLQLVLMHDRSDIAPEIMEAMKRDILDVVAKYMIVDHNASECHVSKDENVAALELSVPVVGLKRATSLKSDSGNRNRSQ